MCIRGGAGLGSGLWEKKAVNALDVYVDSPRRGPGGDGRLALSVPVCCSGRDGGGSNLTNPDVVHKTQAEGSERSLWLTVSQNMRLLTALGLSVRAYRCYFRIVW